MNTRHRPSGPDSPLSAAVGRAPAPLILIVEDNLDQREMFATHFLSEGFRVQTASDGEIAYIHAVASSPDAIVMDLSLPRMDGWEVTRRLKRDTRTAHIPVVACTAHAFGSPVERALDAGCDAYVVKPCLPEDLLCVVRRVIARRVPPQRRSA